MAAALYIPEVDTSRDVYYRRGAATYMDPNGAPEDTALQLYHRKDAAAYMDPAGAGGVLSNQAAGFPVRVNSANFRSPEALFQAFKFPDNPALQRRIGRAQDGDCARRMGVNTPGRRDDWPEVQLDAMRYAAAAKLLCHPEFARALLKTGHRPIVELNFRDGWWGAVPDPDRRVMIGRNAAGKILEQLRDEILETGRDAEQAALNIMNDTAMDYLWINGRPVTAHAVPGRAEP